MARSFATVAANAVRTAGGKADSRRKLIGAVHAVAKKIGISDEDRRALQAQLVPGKSSLADMTLAEIGKIVDHFNARRSPSTGPHPRPHIGKIRALWWTLYWLGEAKEPNDRAIDHFVERQTGVAALRFLDPRSAIAVIEALKSWAGRAGVKWPSDEEFAQLKVAWKFDTVTMANIERHRVLEAIWRKLFDAQIVYAWSHDQYLSAALKLPINGYAWNSQDLDASIRLVGKMWRKAPASRAKGDAAE